MAAASAMAETRLRFWMNFIMVASQLLSKLSPHGQCTEIREGAFSWFNGLIIEKAIGLESAIQMLFEHSGKACPRASGVESGFSFECDNEKMTEWFLFPANVKPL